jgi:hypothetical protein
MTNPATLEFRYRPVRMAFWVLFFAALVGMFCFVAFKSFNPNFLADQHGGRYRWFGEMLSSMPIWLRVGIWALLALICAWAGWLFLRRWLSGTAPLVASAEGVTGFVGMTALRRLSIPWSEISQVQTAQSNLFIRGKAVDRGGIRKSIAPTIAVNLSMIGEKPGSLLQKLEAFRGQPIV